MTNTPFTLTSTARQYANEKRPFEKWDKVQVLIDPQERTLSLDPFDNGDNTYTQAEANGEVLSVVMGARYFGIAYARWFALPEAQAILQRIAAGHTIEWHDGRNHGRLTSDAEDALEELSAFLNPEDDPGDYTVWDAADWFVDYQGGVTADTTDEELAAIIADEEDTAESENAVVNGIAGFLRAHRDDLRDERDAELAE